MAELNFFTKSSIEKSVEEAEKRAEFLPTIDKPGSYTATIVDIVLSESKAKDPMIMISHQIDKEHRNVDDYFVLTNQVGARRLIEWLWNGFAVKIKPIDSNDKNEIAQNIFDQIKKAKGKKIEIAVKIKQELYEKDGKIIITNNADVWYVGKAGVKLTLNMEKAFVALSREDKAKFAEASNDSEVTKMPDDDSDPFDINPEPIEAVDDETPSKEDEATVKAPTAEKPKAKSKGNAKPVQPTVEKAAPVKEESVEDDPWN